MQPGNTAGRIPTQRKTLGDIRRFYNGGFKDDSRFGRFSWASRDIVIGLGRLEFPACSLAALTPETTEEAHSRLLFFGAPPGVKIGTNSWKARNVPGGSG